MTIAKKRTKLRSWLSEAAPKTKRYYSPPNGAEMTYPCIVYKLGSVYSNYADNIPYFLKLQWDITVIDKNTDSEIASALMNNPHFRFDRSFTSDNLNHFVFSTYL